MQLLECWGLGFQGTFDTLTLKWFSGLSRSLCSSFRLPLSLSLVYQNCHLGSLGARGAVPRPLRCSSMHVFFSHRLDEALLHKVASSKEALASPAPRSPIN